MNNEVKVSLNVILPGSVMFSQEQAKALEEEKEGKGLDHFYLRVIKDDDKSTETIRIDTRKSKPAVQSLNLNVDAYNYMTGKEAPYFIKSNIWGRLSKKEKLELHLSRICKSLGGVSFNYEVLS